MESSLQTKNLIIIEGLPERKIRLDHFAGENRNADLVLIGRTSQDRVVISVEAKADIFFGDTIDVCLGKSRINPRSNIPEELKGYASPFSAPRLVFHLPWVDCDTNS